jgi:hypothetical protein
VLIEPRAIALPQAGVGHPVREETGQGVERADVQAAAHGELVQRVGTRQHARAVERQHGIERAGQRIDRQRRCRIITQRTCAQQRVQVSAVIGMPVADEHGVELAGRHPFQQPRHDRVARIDQQPEPVVLDQEQSAARAPP